MWPNPQEEILNGKLYFLCSVWVIIYTTPNFLYFRGTYHVYLYITLLETPFEKSENLGSTYFQTISDLLFLSESWIWENCVQDFYFLIRFCSFQCQLSSSSDRAVSEVRDCENLQHSLYKKWSLPLSHERLKIWSHLLKKSLMENFKD